MSVWDQINAGAIQVERKLVWVWPDDSHSAFIDSTMSEPNGSEYYGEDKVVKRRTFSREIGYPFDFLIENVLDPAHVPFAHNRKQVWANLVYWWCIKLDQNGNLSQYVGRTRSCYKP